MLTLGGAERVAAGGADWLNEQSGAKLWAATPVPVDEFWAGRIGSANGRQPAPSIDAVLNRYGFGLDLPDHHRAAVNAALNAPGGYWGGSGDGRLILIVPKTRRAYVFYAD